MATNRKHSGSPQDLYKQFKQIDVAANGEPVYAEVLALEAGSIGAGGGGGGNVSTAAKGTTAAGSPTSTDVDANRQALDVYVRGGGAGGGAVTVADGADVAQGTTTDAAWTSGAGTVISLLKKIASAGGSAVSIADGADVAQGTTTDLSSANTVIGLLKAIKAAITGTLTTARTWTLSSGTDSVNVGNFPATQNIADGGGSLTVDGSVGISGLVDVEGNVAAVSADSGNPVKVGGVRNTTPPTLANGQRGDLQLDSVGSLRTVLAVPGSNGTVGVGSSIVDGMASVGNPLSVLGFNMMFNGTTYDRPRGNATDGLTVNLGANNDVVVSDGGNVISVDDAGATLSVDDGGGSITVDGTFWQTTQPVSGTVTATPPSSTPVLKNGLSTTVFSVIASSAAVLEDYYVFNPNTSAAYVQIFDVATSGGVTLGTTTPKWSIGVPAGAAANLSRLGLSFANGIQVAATTTATGSTAPTTALDTNWSYR